MDYLAAWPWEQAQVGLGHQSPTPEKVDNDKFITHGPDKNLHIEWYTYRYKRNISPHSHKEVSYRY